MINITTWIGMIGSFFIITYAISGTTATPSIFINYPGMGIVLGGVTGTLFIAYKSAALVRVFRSLFRIFFDKRETPRRIAMRYVQYARTVNEQGIVGLERELANTKHSLEKDALELVLAGYRIDDIKSIIENEIEKRMELESEDAEVFETLARFSPAFGMLGTIVGLIAMLQGMGSDVATLGPALAVALVTTFYGVLLGTGIFSPIAVKIHRFKAMDLVIYNVILAGTIHLCERRNYVYVRDSLNSFLLDRFKMKDNT